jgi:hypothetical protein
MPPKRFQGAIKISGNLYQNIRESLSKEQQISSRTPDKINQIPQYFTHAKNPNSSGD